MSTSQDAPNAHAHAHAHAHHNANNEGDKSDDLHALSLAYQTYMKHDEAECNHFADVAQAFRQYAAFAMCHWANHQYRLHSLPESQRAVLPNALKRDTPEFHARATQFKEAAIRNQFCLDCILRHAGVPHSQELTNMTNVVADSQVSKVSSVIKSLARDWSADGKAERDMAYGPMIRQIQTYLPMSTTEPVLRPKICVPGAGLGRLALELVRLGYTVQGNEFSLHMLLASDFVLNAGIATPDRPMKLSPWLLESRNVHKGNDPVRLVQIPDVDPWEVLSPSDASPPDFSMAAGDFFSIYNHPKEIGQWDCVAASFFLDAVPSLVEHLQLIHRMLRPGGVLVNFGPLLFHWSGPAMRPDDRSLEEYKDRFSHLDPRYLCSIDLTYQDVKEIMLKIGFEIVEEKTGIKCLYTADKRSMMNMVYRCVSFVARRLPDDDPAPDPTFFVVNLFHNMRFVAF
eukprot:Nitzschia sp. Nitz4//scaffold64_size103689//73664//75458//NITZ4_004444-RA/size103689-snap-gene-0.131-mRNA-1//-1//CDS//3329556154//4962//frame0